MVYACSICALVTVLPSQCSPSQPDAFSFNTAIAACGRRGEWRRSLDILAGMEVEGVPPTIFSYNAAIGACAKAGQWRLGLELLAKVSMSVFLSDLAESVEIFLGFGLFKRAMWAVDRSKLLERTLESLRRIKCHPVDAASSKSYLITIVLASRYLALTGRVVVLFLPKPPVVFARLQQ